MQSVTLTIALLGSVLVLFLRPPYALAAYFLVLVWYPDYLRVSIGTIDISAGRIVVAVLLLRCLFDDRLWRSFLWSRLDTWVALAMTVFAGMYILTHPFSAALENRGGFLMDTFLTYLATRLCISDRRDLATFAKGIAVVLVPMAVLGVVEATTSSYVYRNLHQYCPWRPDVPLVRPRFGLARAHGSFSHSIMFGASFVMFLPMVWALRHHKGFWSKLAYPVTAVLVLGALSSMSSAPWGMLLVVLLALGLQKYAHWLKAVLVGLVICCLLVEVASNRPFYHVILQYGNFGRGDWWQRAKLIDSAIEDIGQWWLAGYGGKDPGWGAASGMAFTDCNNEFLLKGVRCGLLGVIALVAILVVAFRSLIRSYSRTTDRELRSFYWAMGSALVGIIVIWQGVSFFGQMPALFYLLLGAIGSSVGFARCAQTGGKTSLTAHENGLAPLYGRPAE